MRKRYDFTRATRNSFAGRLKRQVTIRLDDAGQVTQSSARLRPASPSPSRTPPSSAGSPSPSARAASSPGARPGERFAPGTVLGERYRIVGLVGRGGMGEFYRADDLKLEHPVALKFLPQAVEGDADRLERLYGKVRLARQVSHPAVCRVWDVGEFEGQHFLSMEFVDGENLSSLLRRIGRFPPDKAIDVALQVCAGLAAAHEKGVPAPGPEAGERHARRAGARAVLVGRAYAYGLGAGGEAGVARAIDILRTDLIRTLKLLGCASVADLDRSYVDVPPEWRVRPVPQAPHPRAS